MTVTWEGAEQVEDEPSSWQKHHPQDTRPMGDMAKTQRFYPDITMWWERYVKKNFKGSSDKKKENVHPTSELWEIICMNVYTTYVVTPPKLTNFRRYNVIRPRSWGYTQNGMREYYSTQLPKTAWRMSYHPCTMLSKCSAEGKPGRYTRRRTPKTTISPNPRK